MGEVERVQNVHNVVGAVPVAYRIKDRRERQRQAQHDTLDLHHEEAETEPQEVENTPEVEPEPSNEVHHIDFEA